MFIINKESNSNLVKVHVPDSWDNADLMVDDVFIQNFPLIIGDAIVSRATLHNIGYIEALGLEIGCDVEVIRSGEIIPRVVKRV